MSKKPPIELEDETHQDAPLTQHQPFLRELDDDEAEEENYFLSPKRRSYANPLPLVLFLVAGMLIVFWKMFAVVGDPMDAERRQYFAYFEANYEQVQTARKMGMALPEVAEFYLKEYEREMREKKADKPATQERK